MTEKPAVTLASGSAIRAKILRGAGVPFEIIRPGVDESTIKMQGQKSGLALPDLALKLAEAKCLAVASHQPGLVIGSDQIMEFEGSAFDKPATLEDARARLRAMQGQPHTLINATVLARDGQVVWHHIEQPELVLRELSDAEIDLYLGSAEPDILSSVGAYQLEGLGSRLFERTSGDYFAILGLALFPLLAELRRQGALDF